MLGSAPVRVLSDAIYREAGRLGASLVVGGRSVPASVKSVPESVREFYCDFVWTRSSRLCGEIDELDLSGVSFFGPLQEFDGAHHGVAGCQGRWLFAIGSRLENSILLIDGNEEADDPTVFEVDHAPEPGSGLWSYGRLSDFLAALRPC